MCSGQGQHGAQKEWKIGLFCSFRQETLPPKKKKKNEFWAKLEEEEERKKKNKKKRDDNKDAKKSKKVNPWAPCSSRWARWATSCSSYRRSNTGPQHRKEAQRVTQKTATAAAEAGAFKMLIFGGL